MGKPEPDTRVSGAASLRQAISAAGDRVLEIVDSAERVGEEIRAEAEAEAAEYLRARKQEADRLWGERAQELAELAKGLPARAERLLAEASSLAGELERVRDHLRALGEARDDSGPAPSAYPGTGDGRSAAPSPDEANAAAPPLTGESGVTLGDWTEPGPEPGASEGVPEEALLRATQMAVAGTERAEIQRALSSEFGLADPASVTDQVLGKAEH